MAHCRLSLFSVRLRWRLERTGIDNVRPCLIARAIRHPLLTTIQSNPFHTSTEEQRKHAKMELSGALPNDKDNTTKTMNTTKNKTPPTCCTTLDHHHDTRRRMSERTEWVYNFVGEILFSISAIFFTWVSLEAGDWKSLTASLFFFVACLAFLVPMWVNRPFCFRTTNNA
jgi:hypothetical protein